MEIKILFAKARNRPTIRRHVMRCAHAHRNSLGYVLNTMLMLIRVPFAIFVQQLLYNWFDSAVNGVWCAVMWCLAFLSKVCVSSFHRTQAVKIWTEHEYIKCSVGQKGHCRLGYVCDLSSFHIPVLLVVYCCLPELVARPSIIINHEPTAPVPIHFVDYSLHRFIGLL